MDEDEWVKTATFNDSLVVDLLMQLKNSPPTRSGKASILRLDWKVRQRRTKPVALCLVEDDKKGGEPARASPTTPLSWSRATSPSAEATADADRSKAVATSGTAPTKRSRKKKTLAELKEEESVLLKERIYLKKELATLHATITKERANNERLKRRKLDLHLQMESERIAVSVSSRQTVTGQEREVGIDDHLSARHSPQQASSKVEQGAASFKTSFLLPDLNLPLEETGFEVLCGVA
ncbi:hypothetical protein RJ641_024366 [Dillenia turbinata]|uniref:BZIP domain-containing protein n=1 Tax=Dillenia turbinata TaxID=194707 RepID=A0AAN8YWI8_9MAGN